MRFETERMMVRSFQEGDLPDLQEILGDAQTMVYMEPPYTLEQTARFLQDFCIGRKGALAAEDKASGRVIGYLLCNEIQDDIYEIGWIFNRRIWRQGYAYEACCSLVDYAFFSLHAHKLLAETIDPLKSAGLMRKLGMELEGVQRGQSKTMGASGWTCISTGFSGKPGKAAGGRNSNRSNTVGMLLFSGAYQRCLAAPGF